MRLFISFLRGDGASFLILRISFAVSDVKGMLYLMSRGSLLTGRKASWVTNGKELPAQSVLWIYCPFQCFNSKGGKRNNLCLWRKWKKKKQTSSLLMELFFEDTQIIMRIMDFPTQRWAKLVRSPMRSCYNPKGRLSRCSYLKIYSGLEVVALVLNNRLPVLCLKPLQNLQDFALHVHCGCLEHVPDR